MKQEQTPLSIFAEDVLKNYGAFMEEHDDKLKLLNNKMPVSHHSDSVSPISMTPVIELNFGQNESSSSTVSEMSFEESELLANKTLTTLANLCNQCRDLAHTAKQYQLAFMFTDFRLLDDMRSSPSSAANGAGLEGPLFRMSGSMEFFCQVFFLLKRIVVILQNLWRQLASAADSVPVSNIFTVFDCMAELLEHAVVFSELAIQSKISVKWTLYREWLVTLSNSGLTADRCSAFELAGLRSSLAEIESVIAGNLFRYLLDSLRELKKQFSPKDVSNISQHSNAYLRKMLLQVDGNQSNELGNLEEPKHLIRLVAFVAVHHELGIQMEAKLVRNVSDLVNRHQRLPLNQSVYWSPAAFLSQHAKTLLKTPARPQDFQGGGRAHSSALEKMRGSDLKSCRQLGVQISLWSIGMQRVLDAGVFGRLKTFSQLILRGQSYAEQVTRLADSVVNRHVALITPLSKPDWFVLCRLLQYLKVLQKTFESNQVDFVRFTSSLIQWQKQRVLHLLQTTRKKIVDLKLLQRKVNFLSTMKLAEKSILGFPSKKRLTFIDLAVGEFLDKDRLLPADKLKVFPTILQRANNLNSFGNNMQQQLDSSTLIYNYCFLSTSLLKEFTEQQRNPYALQNLVAVCYHLEKSMAIFGSSEQCPTKPSANSLMIEFLRTHLELFLRMETLSHLFQSQDQPFQQTALDYRHCIQAAAMEFEGDYNIIRDNLENYFTATFYNLTTIAPHDWKTYEKMRHFASKVLQLRPIDDHLPNQIIDQGIDVLQIMRNIHTFASTYAYNMNLQLFVETHSRGKHLDIIGTRHVANSVQTHGSGIINTTVNFIYQFLRQKFYTFSTFLHDEQIKSRLLKELRFHAEHKHNNNQYQSYPYERAENFLRKIRKLGFASNGETYIDLFRKVITQVGNAVGYVRLLQAGSKNANYRSRSYMPKLSSQFSPGEEPTKGLLEATASSIREYEKSVGHMRECYSGNTNYFKLLVQGFKPFLCNPHNHHLKTFFLITPALIMNYIDYRVKEKLKIHQKDLAKMSLFEDGFAIGLVYILSMLNQQGEFHELGWSQTTAERLKEERAKVRNLLAGQQTTTTSTKEKLSQTMAITEHHVNAYEHEYNLLYATLSSSEIFFQ